MGPIKNKFVCTKCDLDFCSKFTLERHLKSKHFNIKDFKCKICNKDFFRKDKLNEHMTICNTKCLKRDQREQKHREKQRQQLSKHCENCEIDVDDWRYHKLTNMHKKATGIKITDTVFLLKTSFNERIETYMLENDNVGLLNVPAFMKHAQNIMSNYLVELLEKHIAFKYNLELFCEYVKGTPNDLQNLVSDIKSFQSKMVAIHQENQLMESFVNHAQSIDTKTQEFQERDSGWSLKRIARVEININQYTPIRGSNFIKTPQYLYNKKACINVKNNDEYCFKWCIISALNPANANSDRKSSYNIDDISKNNIELSNGIILDFANLQFPLHIKDIEKFELLNQNISVNVFGYEDEGINKIVGPYYATKLEKPNHINMLLLEENDKKHYVWIKDLSKLIRNQVTKKKNRCYVCNSCLLTFGKQEQLDRHKPQCRKTVTIMPAVDKSTLMFKSYHRMMDVPFVIYADFESVLQTVDPDSNDSFKSSTSNTINHHVPCAFGLYIKCSFDDSLNKYITHTGVDSPKIFIESLIAECTQIYNKYLSKKKPMLPLTHDEEILHQTTKKCHICQKSIYLDRVADHCHLTGKYRGPAHSKCNLNYRVPKFIPIYFHNFSGYDCHMFVKELANFDGQISMIPINKELYVSLSFKINMSDNKQNTTKQNSKSIKIMNIKKKDTKNNLIKNKDSNTIELRFLDSYRFMASSLDSLTQNLSEGDFHILRSVFSNENEFNLLRRKGVFPYEYINSFARLDEEKLPSIEHFYSNLTESKCSLSDYEYALNIWQTFKCSKIRDYLELYLKTDVLLLADVFENFRKICKGIFKLDPSHYYTAPGLSWDAMLKYTNVRLQLLTDINMYTFIQRGIRGGIVQCSKRHSVANNKYMVDYNENALSKFLMYLDANNLYGWAMSQPLPFGKFEWMEDLNLDVNKIPIDSEIGYILEVDLEYPETIHDDHNDLPFCAENKTSNNSKFKKLIPDLTNKFNYIIHYKNLQQCLKYGMKLKKIHNILKFNQSCWLKDYIDLNTRHRTEAKNDFEKNFFKLLNNAVYGKTMENVDKRKDIKIVTEWESKGRHLGARALISKTNFHSCTTFLPNMLAIQMNRVHTYYNKPIYLGFCVLDISKWKMYDFHYGYMKPKFKENISLNYMDTDSFIYTIETEDFYKDISVDINSKFDTSDYKVENVYGFPRVNKKVMGMMKDENQGKIMREFVGLRSKMYSIKIDNEDAEIKKCKGVKKTVLNNLSLEDYKTCLYKKQLFYGKMCLLQSNIHEIYTKETSKVALSYMDDKRHIDENGVDTHAWGHTNLSKFKNIYMETQ